MTTKRRAEPACPKCGGYSGYFVSDHVNGWEERMGTWDGGEEVTNTDNLRYRVSKTAICQDCNKRVPRPDGATRARNLPAFS